MSKVSSRIWLMALMAESIDFGGQSFNFQRAIMPMSLRLSN